MNALHSVFSPELYVHQIDRLWRKAQQRPGLMELSSEGLNLAAMYPLRHALCKRLAAEVHRGEFRLSPMKRALVRMEGKLRTLYRPELLDAVVLGALAQVLTQLLEHTLQDEVHAFRPGRSARQTITRLRTALSEHRRRRPNKRDRGIFVLQRDLSNYGESIPTAESSELWRLLDQLLEAIPEPIERKRVRELVTSACRPVVRHEGGQLHPMKHGLPTGSPIQQPLQNLYLTPVDIALTEAAPAFYARFGDDLLLLEDDPGRACQLHAQLQTSIGAMGLTFNPNKSKNLYFTAPGRPYPIPTKLRFHATSHIEYLGVRVAFDGRLGLKRRRLRQLLQRCRYRVWNTAALAPQQGRAVWVTRALTEALLTDRAVGDPLGEALRDWVDDREQLRQLDHELQLMCAEAVSGRRGVRAFREVPPRDLRAAGLKSLQDLRRRRPRNDG